MNYLGKGVCFLINSSYISLKTFWLSGNICPAKLPSFTVWGNLGVCFPSKIVLWPTEWSSLVVSMHPDYGKNAQNPGWSPAPHKIRCNGRLCDRSNTRNSVLSLAPSRAWEQPNSHGTLSVKEKWKLRRLPRENFLSKYLDGKEIKKMFSAGRKFEEPRGPDIKFTLYFWKDFHEKSLPNSKVLCEWGRAHKLLSEWHEPEKCGSVLIHVFYIVLNSVGTLPLPGPCFSFQQTGDWT